MEHHSVEGRVVIVFVKKKFSGEFLAKKELKFLIFSETVSTFPIALCVS